MRERLVKIGQPKPLFGVLCEADADSVPDRKVAVLLLNSGVMHRIGSCRITVKLARALTETTGLPSLRFDFSGVGDSEPRRGGADFGAGAVAEVREVMDFLQETRGIEHFILYGLCSGAHTSCQVGLVDNRVLGIAQIDSYCYPTLKSRLNYYRPRLASMERWQSLFMRLLGLGKGDTEQEGSGDEQYYEVPEFADIPPHSDAATWVAGLVANNIAIHSIHTGTEPTYNYLEQYRDCYAKVDFGDLLSLVYLPDASHIISQPEYQRQVIEGICSWAAALVAPRQGS